MVFGTGEFDFAVRTHSGQPSEDKMKATSCYMYYN